MRKIIALFVLFSTFGTYAQSQTALTKHYEAYYQQMKLQGDTQGMINALTHLSILKNQKETKDTLAYIYMNNRQYMQALNTIGIENDINASDIAVQVKAVSLKALRQPERAIEQFEIMYKRKANPYLAYELADLYIQTGNNATASIYITNGLSSVKEDMKQAFYESQPPYEVPLKAAFLQMKALIQYNNDKDNIDKAIVLLNEALALAPDFNLAKITKDALEKRKTEGK
ncbi:MAG: hypothetical protein OIF50_09915 [Flavobacteriaceae bacterium]|nr:hypothetical protein [Flavobacteriaceae bacterium]